jgi:hypothetical protein
MKIRTKKDSQILTDIIKSIDISLTTRQILSKLQLPLIK